MENKSVTDGQRKINRAQVERAKSDQCQSAFDDDGVGQL
jgi:hypothetical protein